MTYTDEWRRSPRRTCHRTHNLVGPVATVLLGSATLYLVVRVLVSLVTES